MLPYIKQIHRNNLIRKANKIKPVLWLLLFCLIYTFLAYRGDGLTIGGDNVIPLHSTKYLARLLYPSDPWSGFGSVLPPIFSLPPLPDMLLFSLFSSMGFDIYAANKLYVLVLAISSATSIYYLSRTIFHESGEKDLIGIVASSAYLLNPWTWADTYNTMVFIELSLVQTGFVLFVAFTIRYFQTRRIRFPLYAGICTFLLFSYPGISAYRLAFLALFSYLTVAAYYLIRWNGTRLRAFCFDIIKGLIIVSLLGCSLNSYWLVPFLQNARSFSSFASGFQTKTTFNDYSNLINTLRLMNSWSFYSGYVPYSETYLTHPVLIVLSFAWPFFAFLPLLSKKVVASSKALVLYAATISITLLVWWSGSPLKQSYMAVVNVNIASYYFLKPFYNTAIFSQLVLTTEYAILIGLFSSSVHSWLLTKRRGFLSSKRNIVTVFSALSIIAILASSSWPIITGDIMKGWYSPDRYGVRIPDSYWKADEYLERMCDLNQRTLLLPPCQAYIGTEWGYQGTSQFYNRMFNVPLITGNEIPYSIASNKTMEKQVYSIYYMVPNVNDTLDVIQQESGIIPWQNDKATITDNVLQIYFNGTTQTARWHQLEIKLPSGSSWSDFSHFMIQCTVELDLSNLEVGVGDTYRHVGWWHARNYVCAIINNRTFVPIENDATFSNSSRTINLLMDLRKPDLGDYAIHNVTSIYVQYFASNSSSIPTMQISKMLAVKLTADTLYQARLLANYGIRYLVVDLAIKDGSKDDPEKWLGILNNSVYFKVVWQGDFLYIFENGLA